MSNIKITNIKWDDLSSCFGQTRAKFNITVNKRVYYGYLFFRYNGPSPGFVLKFENKLISKHQQYKSLRSNILASYKNQYPCTSSSTSTDRSLSWTETGIRSFERANVK